MRKIEQIKVESLVTDKLPLNPSVRDLMFFILSGGQVPPIHVQKVANGWRVRDGRHRVAAYKLLGRDTIMAKFSECKQILTS